VFWDGTLYDSHAANPGIGQTTLFSHDLRRIPLSVLYFQKEIAPQKKELT
jgi:hypothetical protein